VSLARRLILLVLPVPALFAAANFWWLMHQQATLLREQEAQRARTLAASLASNCALALETGNPAQMQASLNALFVERDILSLEVIAPDGINGAYERLVKGDIRYRFVIDMGSLA